MFSYFLALSLPLSIRSRLASFCYGLPQVRWIEEENFHLTLRYFGPLSNIQLEEIQSHLEQLFFHPFFLTLKGVGYFRSRDHGVIWMGTEENVSLLSLKKELDLSLKKIFLPTEDRRPFHPHITLGRYERLNMERLGEYLTQYADYQSEPIEINTCYLMKTQQTPKRVFYEIIQEYQASPFHIGED